MRVQFAILFGVAIAAQVPEAFAQQQSAATALAGLHVKCPVLAPPPARLSGWSAHAEKPGAAHSQELFRSDVANLVPLKPHENVSYPVTPSILKPKLYGGVFPLNIAVPDIYGVAVGASGWVDVVQSGQIIHSVAGEAGPTCTGIHKIIYFKLQRGAYTVEISNSRVRQVRMLLIQGGPALAQK